MSGACDQFVMEDQSCDCFDLDEFIQSFDMGINFLLGPPTPEEVIFIPSVDENGNLSWSNNGGLPNPPTVNIKGPPGSGVESVNGKTGVVDLTPTDIGLGNVANERQYSANNPPPYPVSSVNGKTGAVTVKGLKLTEGAFSSFPHTISSNAIKENMEVFSCYFSNPEVIVGNVSYSTSNGSITLSGTMAAGSTSVTLILFETS